MLEFFDVLGIADWKLLREVEEARALLDTTSAVTLCALDRLGSETPEGIASWHSFIYLPIEALLRAARARTEGVFEALGRRTQVLHPLSLSQEKRVRLQNALKIVNWEGALRRHREGAELLHQERCKLQEILGRTEGEVTQLRRLPSGWGILGDALGWNPSDEPGEEAYGIAEFLATPGATPVWVDSLDAMPERRNGDPCTILVRSDHGVIHVRPPIVEREPLLSTWPALIEFPKPPKGLLERLIHHRWRRKRSPVEERDVMAARRWLANHPPIDFATEEVALAAQLCHRSQEEVRDRIYLYADAYREALEALAQRRERVTTFEINEESGRPAVMATADLWKDLADSYDFAFLTYSDEKLLGGDSAFQTFCGRVHESYIQRFIVDWFAAAGRWVGFNEVRGSRNFHLEDWDGASPRMHATSCYSFHWADGALDLGYVRIDAWWDLESTTVEVQCSRRHDNLNKELANAKLP